MKVQTVLGLIDPDDVGITLPHEHILVDMTPYFEEPTELSEKHMAHSPITIENLYWIRPNCLKHWADMKVTDEELAIKELLIFKKCGGNTVVSLTNIGLGRDPLAMARISRATGLNIIMGSGYYIEATHPPELAKKSEEEIAEEIVRDITVGVGNTGIRSGIIGEIGCSTLSESEQRVIRAAVEAQKRTGAALNIHPVYRDKEVLQILDILGSAGADLSRTIIDHVGVAGFSRETRLKLAQAGCYLEWDNTGFSEVLTSYLGRILDMPSDSTRIRDIMQHIEDGYLNQLLISLDICFNHLLVNYGGYGYAHILRNIVPVMRDKGFTEEQINTILMENPKRFLTLAPPKK